MKPTSTILSIAAAAGMMLAAAPSPVWAESAAQSGEGIEFLNNVTCPNPADPTNGACYDPKAAGTKLFGKLAVTYDKNNGVCFDSGVQYLNGTVNNVYANATLQLSNANKGTVAGMFSTSLDQYDAPDPVIFPFCFGTKEFQQAQMVVELIRTKVMTHFYGCNGGDAGCPGFKVKSLSNWQYNLGVQDTGTRGFSVDVTIAVQ